jgi:hypothetical protein
MDLPEIPPPNSFDTSLLNEDRGSPINIGIDNGIFRGISPPVDEIPLPVNIPLESIIPPQVNPGADRSSQETLLRSRSPSRTLESMTIIPPLDATDSASNFRSIASRLVQIENEDEDRPFPGDSHGGEEIPIPDVSDSDEEAANKAKKVIKTKTVKVRI